MDHVARLSGRLIQITVNMRGIGSKNMLSLGKHYEAAGFTLCAVQCYQALDLGNHFYMGYVIDMK